MVVAPQEITLTPKDYASPQEVRWCPGCGDYSILAQMKKVLANLQAKRENTVFVSGIGCSSRFPYYLDTYGIHSIHGRAPAVATGLKLSRPELDVWVITGDGDGFSIGGNHMLHAIRRNVDINIILFNNRIYGLTKGQYSPTSELGKKTKSTPYGSVDHPLNPLSVAVGSGATFVARSVDVHIKHLGEVLEAAYRHKGTSFVEIYQNCNIFNDGEFDWATDRQRKDETIIELVEGKPMLFGKDKNKGLRMNSSMQIEVVILGENGISIDDILVHNPKRDSSAMALALGQIHYPEFPEPMGIIRQVEKSTYNDMVRHQVDTAVSSTNGNSTMEALLNAGETWVVE